MNRPEIDKNTLFPNRSKYRRPTEVQVEQSKLRHQIELINERKELRRHLREAWD